jgi:hypothetical protein
VLLQQRGSVHGRAYVLREPGRVQEPDERRGQLRSVWSCVPAGIQVHFEHVRVQRRRFVQRGKPWGVHHECLRVRTDDLCAGQAVRGLGRVRIEESS